LKENYEIISLNDFLDLRKNNIKLDKDKFVITLDDNYKEYYTEVFPLKNKYNFEMTLFVSIDPIENKEPLFVDSLIHAINLSKEKILDLTHYGLKEYPIVIDEEKNKAIVEINEFSKMLSKERRKELIDAIIRQLEIDKNSIKKFLLTWDELIEMNNNGVEIGAHTMSHPVLAEIPLEEAKYEISESKRILEQKLNTKVKMFAYPYGYIESYNDKIKNHVKETGFLCACSLHEQSNEKDLYALGRINMDTSMCSLWNERFLKPLFVLELSGLGNLVFLRWLKKVC
jgi:peptidoglycan/xylan/chitin deacetylase (PgdA/CDA1 family)